MSTDNIRLNFTTNIFYILKIFFVTSPGDELRHPDQQPDAAAGLGGVLHAPGSGRHQAQRDQPRVQPDQAGELCHRAQVIFISYRDLQ